MSINWTRVFLYSALTCCAWMALLTLFNILAASGAFAHVPWIDGLAY